MCTLSLLTLFAYSAFSQDTIYKHNGEKLNVKVRYLTESKVIYGLAGDSKSYFIGRPEVEKIVYESGYLQSVTRKVQVQGVKDWKNVVITYNQFDVVGLTKKGEIKSDYGDKSEVRKKAVDTKEAEKIQKTAAALGGHIVYVKRESASAVHKEETAEEASNVVVYGY